MEFSTEQLRETRGVVVCPQCLSSDKVPGYEAPSKPAAKRQEARVKKQEAPAMTTPPAHKSRPTPPPHRSKVASSEKPSSRSDTPPVKPKKKKKSKKSSSSTGFLAPKSALGCLWRSVVYTLLLLIIYIIFGMLLQGL